MYVTRGDAKFSLRVHFQYYIHWQHFEHLLLCYDDGSSLEMSNSLYISCQAVKDPMFLRAFDSATETDKISEDLRDLRIYCCSLCCK